MSIVSADRQSKGAPASQGGQFKAVAKTEGGIELTVDTSAFAALPIDWEANRGFISFVPSEVGSDLPAHYVDADEYDVTAGISTDLDDSVIDGVYEEFLHDRYDACADHPDFPTENVELRFSLPAPESPYTRGDATTLLETTALRRYLADRETGAYDTELATYRAAQAIAPDFAAGKLRAAEYETLTGWAKGAADAKAGKAEGLILYAQAAVFAIGEFTNADMPKKQTTQLNRLYTRGFCDRAAGIAEAERALELLPQGRGERAGITAVRDWLVAQA